jgi:hypothetical protein
MGQQAEALLPAAVLTGLDLLRTAVYHFSFFFFLIVRRERATRDSSARFFGSITIFFPSCASRRPTFAALVKASHSGLPGQYAYSVDHCL